MDTISRENNSMLPVGGIIVGIIGLVLGGIALVQISKVNKTISTQAEKIAKIDTVESQAAAASQAADRVARDGKALFDSTQKAFTDVSSMIGDLSGRVTKIEEAAKKAPVAAAAKKAGEHVAPVAGPGEYVVQAGDTSGTKIAKANGVSLADLQAVNPGVDWTKIKVGQKLKLPKK